MTANGPAHLGHVGGPFLRMDVLSRHLKRIGHRVTTALTTDQYENHIEVQATKLNLDRAEFARGNDDLIRQGLEVLAISYDIFPNTGLPDVSAKFANTAAGLTGALANSNGYAIREEKLPIDDAAQEDGATEDRFCIGGWLGASCPSCGEDAGSYFCERCGMHFSPAEAIAPFSRRGRITDWLVSRSAYLGSGLEMKLRELWDTMVVQTEYRQIAENYLLKNGATMRLSVPSSYGIVWSNDNFINRQTLFSYSSLLYAHSLFCGELSKDDSPFAADSETILISATGIDNAIPMLVGLSGTALAQEKYRSFDRIYFNRFLRLEGLKFSTSRNHVIWALDIQNQKKVNRDLLRAYLCKICPEEHETDFLLGEFTEFHNITFRKLATCFKICVNTLGSGEQESDVAWTKKLESLYNRQAEAFDDRNLHVSNCVAPLEVWIDKGFNIRSPSQAAAWLMGFSFLAAPILPRMALEIGTWLGFSGSVNTEDFGSPAHIQPRLFPMPDGEDTLRTDDLECLVPSWQEKKLEETV